MIGGIAGSQLHRDAAFQLAQADPVAAARTLARGLRPQSTGAKRAVVRRLIEAFDEAEPGLLQLIASDIAKLAAEHGDTRDDSRP